ncbi:ribonuclease HI [Alternaria panax]|uniref:Ribonuclease H n=1 Tax=Alternaria panax TaxID=48097 RepID=A0AAD4II51_9PLEO|nr:ribonuclease HI [Alternaria panax]
MARGGKWEFYGVSVGRQPGVYKDWPAAEAQVKGYSGAKHSGFKTRWEAETFVYGAPVSLQGDPSASRSPSAPDNMDRSAETSESAPKRQKTADASPTLIADSQIKIEPGSGPLPTDAEDNFDRTIKLDEQTGSIRHKTEEELGKRKRQPTGDSKGTIVVYTDGGSRGNGMAGAKAGCGVYFGDGNPKNVQEPIKGDSQTNNRAELVAIARALDHVPIDQDVEIVTDSQYSRNCLTVFFSDWEKRGWKTKAKEVPANKEIIQPIIARIREREQCGAKTIINWVYGHAVTQGNIEADALANKGMDKWTAELTSESVFDMSETLRTKYRNPHDPKDEFDDTDEIEDLFRDLAEESANGFGGDPSAHDALQPEIPGGQGIAAASQEVEDAWADHPQLVSSMDGEQKELDLEVAH